MLVELLVTVLLLPASEARQKVCSDKSGTYQFDMRSELGPIRDQDSIGWCYSFTAADMLSHHLYKKGYGPDTRQKANMISASAGALRFNSVKRNQALGAVSARRRVAEAIKPILEARQKELETLQVKKSERASQLGASLQTNEMRAKLRSIQRELRDLERRHERSQNSKHQTRIEKQQREIESLEHALDAQKFEIQDTLANDTQFKSLALAAYQKEMEIRELSKVALGLPLPQLEEPRGGFIKDALSELVKGSLCREKDVASDDFGSINQGQYRALELNDLISKGVYSYLNAPNDENLCSAIEASKKLFKNTPVDQIRDIFKSYTEQDPLSSLVEKSCGEPPLPPQVMPNAIEDFYSSKDELLNTVDSLLESGKIAGIAYFPDMFQLGGDLLSEEESSASRSSHASTIVGRGFNCETDEPEYLLRNSWGPRSCERNRVSYRSLREDDPRIRETNIKEQACQSTCRLQSDQSEVERAACRLDCLDSKVKSIASFQPQPPFRCTEDGYYVVKRSELKRALLGVAYTK